MVLTLGQLRFEINNKKYQLKKFDTLSLFSDKTSYKIICVKSSDLYLISSTKLSIKKAKQNFLILKETLQQKIYGVVNAYQDLILAKTLI